MLASLSSGDAFSTCLATEACSASAPMPRGGNKAASSWLWRGPEFSQNTRPAACSSTSASCSRVQSGAAHALWKAAGRPCRVSRISYNEHGLDALMDLQTRPGNGCMCYLCMRIHTALHRLRSRMCREQLSMPTLQMYHCTDSRQQMHAHTAGSRLVACWDQQLWPYSP